MKEKDDQKTIDAAKKAAKQREETNVFEAVESDIVEEDEAERAVSVVPTEQEGKKKGTRPARPPAESVRCASLYFILFTQVGFSTATLRRISRYRIGNSTTLAARLQANLLIMRFSRCSLAKSAPVLVL